MEKIMSEGPEPETELKKQPNEDKLLVHWFRRGLRLHDNPAFYDGLQEANRFRCIYILDPYYAGVGVNKWRFLLQSLEDLDTSLRKYNSRLFVIRGQPLDIFPKLVEEWSLKILSFEEEPEPHGRERDKKIRALVQSFGVQVICRASHTLYDLPKLLDLNNGSVPLTYKEFLDLVQKMGPPHPPICAPQHHTLGPHSQNQDMDLDPSYSVPNLQNLGTFFYTARTVRKSLLIQAYVATYDNPSFSWESLLPQPTGLAPYLRFGCLSSRLLYTKLDELHVKLELRKRPAPLSLFGQLLWREFFYLLAYDNPNFDSMKLNPLCVKIPWDTHPQCLAKWANGHTGYPLIDAAMTQLRAEGWIHHLCKHATVCFLTRGHLFLSWEEGAKVFEELSLDGDWALNNGTLLWLSGSSFFQTLLRTYCPVKFGKRVDPQGNYIKKYIPALKNIPSDFIHEPWKAPDSVQNKSRCFIGSDYPVPMIDHDLMVKLNSRRLAQAYQCLISFQGFREEDRKNVQIEAVSTEEEESRVESEEQQASESSAHILNKAQSVIKTREN